MSALTFDNKISSGNVLTIIGGIIAAALMLGSLNTRNSEQDGRIGVVETDIRNLNQRVDDTVRVTNERLSEIRGSQIRIEGRLSEISAQIVNKQDRKP